MGDDVGYRVVREPCSECPFKGRFELRWSGGLKAILEETYAKDCPFVCHMSSADDELTVLNDGQLGHSLTRDGGSAAVCAGWLEAQQGWRPQVLRIADHFELVEMVEPH